jgi:hypothetical protein
VSSQHEIASSAPYGSLGKATRRQPIILAEPRLTDLRGLKQVRQDSFLLARVPLLFFTMSDLDTVVLCYLICQQGLGKSRDDEGSHLFPPSVTPAMTRPSSACGRTSDQRKDFAQPDDTQSSSSVHHGPRNAAVSWCFEASNFARRPPQNMDVTTVFNSSFFIALPLPRCFPDLLIPISPNHETLTRSHRYFISSSHSMWT